MRFLKHTLLALGLLGVACVLALLGYQFRVNARLRTELETARAPAGALAALRIEHTRLAALAPARAELVHREQEELARRRIEIDALRVQLATLKRQNVPHAENHRAQLEHLRAQAAAIPVPPGMLPPEALHNVGRATPAAAWQTAQWAATTGDFATKTELSSFTPEARDALKVIFDRLSDAERAGFGTPEQMGMKVMAIDSLLMPAELRVGFPRLQLVSETPSGPDEVTLVERLQAPDGSFHDRPPFRLRRFPDGWKWSLGLETVAAVRTKLAIMPPAQRLMLAGK